MKHVDEVKKKDEKNEKKRKEIAREKIKRKTEYERKN